MLYHQINWYVFIHWSLTMCNIHMYVIWMGEVKRSDWMKWMNEWMTSGLLTNSYWKFVYVFSIFLSFHLFFGWLLQTLSKLYAVAYPSAFSLSWFVPVLNPFRLRRIFRCHCVFSSIHCDWLNMFRIDDDVCVCVYMILMDKQEAIS